MADSFKTLADLVTLNDARNADVDVSDILNDSPLLRLLPAETAPETTYYYTKYTTAPTVGFRAVNDGRENSKSVDTPVTRDLKIVDATFSVDVAIANAFKMGADAYISKEAMRHLQAAFFLVERQFFYGTVSPGSSAGFLGFGDEADLNQAADTMVVNAGGTTAATGSSAWLLRVNPDEVAIILGRNGNIEIAETTTTRIAGSATGTFPAYYTPITGWAAMKRGSVYSAVRIANLTEDSGKGLTDDLIAKGIEKFRAGSPPTHLVCSRRSLRQLQDSRTATNTTGAPAPFPQESFGVQIVVTDAIVNTETLLA